MPHEHPLPSQCEDRMLLKNQGITGGERLFIRNFFSDKNPSMEYVAFMSRVLNAGFVPAGQLHMLGLIHAGIPRDWEYSVLIFPGTIYTPREKFYECFCMPVLLVLDGVWILDHYCSRNLLCPDVRVVFTSNATIH